MANDFTQHLWDEQLEEHLRRIVQLALEEDLHGERDWTTEAIVPEHARGSAYVVARRDGVLAGLAAARVVLATLGGGAIASELVQDGAAITAGQQLAKLEGPARTLLTAERTLLNIIGRLSGVATLTRRYVDLVAGTRAAIYDTRKTTPGWRRLEKYAVRCGGGHNHRTGLFDGVLIKDNHLALASQQQPGTFSPADAVRRAREVVRQATAAGSVRPDLVVEVEVDTLDQLRDVLSAVPDIVLLDNMRPDQLREAVRLRDLAGGAVILEASGGVDLTSVRAIAESGVDRISIGALTHAAISLDVALDWES